MMRWWLALFLFALMTPFSSSIDLTVSNFFYRDHDFISNSWTSAFYLYGYFPGDIVAGLALMIFILSFLIPAWKKWRAPAFVLAFTMLIGALLIVHGVLKDHWGRPRPRQTIEFGGSQPFRPYYSPNFFHQPEPSKSFPCGHCSTGFYFFALALVGRRFSNRSVETLGWTLALTLGIALSILRIAQGGHFFSDTIAAALIMWYTALCCDWFCYEYKIGAKTKDVN